MKEIRNEHDFWKPIPVKRAYPARSSALRAGIALSAISGVMLLLSLPPYGLWPLAWIAFVPYVFAQYHLMPFTPEGAFQQIYGKNHAFGEPPTAMTGVYPVYDTPLGRLATLICHDASYTDVSRRLAASGAQIIAAPIREFGGFGEQYWTNALFRAVENRTAVVVSGVSTISAIINPDGTRVAFDSDSEGSRVVLTGDVKLGSGPTLYTSLGDILGWVSMAGFVFFMVFQSVVENRAKKAAKTARPVK